MDRYSPGCEHFWSHSLKKAQDNMVLQEHQSSSRSCWRPLKSVMGPRHFLGAFKISPAGFFFEAKKNKRLKLWSLHCSAGTTPIPKISVYLGRCCLPGVFLLYGRMAFSNTLNSSKENQPHFCVQEPAMTWPIARELCDFHLPFPWRIHGTPVLLYMVCHGSHQEIPPLC